MAAKTTPLMEQYLAIKKKYSDAVLFFRMGDFYEMFYEDAKIASDVLGLVLTSRAHGKAADVPLAGFPHHSLEPYLSKMLNAGRRVAICEQVEDPKKAKGIVKRDVIEVVSPGTATSENVIDADSNNYLVSLCRDGDTFGMAGIDVSTGTFFLTEGPWEVVSAQVESLNPPEILVPEESRDEIAGKIRLSPAPLLSTADEYFYNREYAVDTLLGHFGTASLKGFGCDEYTAGVSAAGAALKYVSGMQNGRLGHIRGLSVLNPSQYMILDKTTRRNLELFSTMRIDGSAGSLLSVIDRTVTRMGKRKLREWLFRPLLDADKIRMRLQAVDELCGDREMRDSLQAILGKVNDIERLTGRINGQRANARDLRGLCDSLKTIPAIAEALSAAHSILLIEQRGLLDPMPDMTEEIDRAIVDDPPAVITDGKMIRGGYNEELDRLLELAHGGKQWIFDLQEQEREATGIASLKIKYNKVFGYYIEVTNPHKDKVPDRYIRKQTLVNAERYITPEMKEREEEILTAEEKIVELERRLFMRLTEKIALQTDLLQRNADTLARIDVLCGLAAVAEDNRYCKPAILDDTGIAITDGRHPVVEQLLPPGEPFIPNDCTMTPGEDLIHVITGPNMAGKSTYLRQVGLCVLLAQIGSFVPAARAEIGVVDRIFTRVGAMDDVSRGESTFLVEMLELANILNNATPRSLLLLDEIGRGTSTFDGLSIAWAVVEHLHNTPRVAAKTLFATHYHELTVIAQRLEQVKNFRVEVREWEDSVIFLRKISPGSADHSYGIQVAQMAGIPRSVILRAKEILARLEEMELSQHGSAAQTGGETESGMQINLFSHEDASARSKLHNIDPENITPLEAIQLLFELKKLYFGNDSQSDS